MTRSRKAFWLVANVIMLLVITGIVWVTLLPAIWGPSDTAESEWGERRAKTNRPR